MIYGINKVDNKEEHDLSEAIKDLLKRKMQLTLYNAKINYVKRLGRRGDRNRPIVISSTKFSTKFRIMR